MGCQHLEELYELFLLGVLSTERADELREHLVRECPYCRERIREAAQTVYLLSLTARPARPHPRLKSQLLRSVPRRS